MFERFINRVGIEFVLQPDGPVTVRWKAGDAGQRNDSPCVRLYGASGSPYIPGSSFKGVLRAHAESILRAIGKRVDPVFDGRNRSHAVDAEGEQADGPTAHRAQCAASRVFGSLGVQGRTTFSDLTSARGEPDTQWRDGVGIDRQSQQAARSVMFRVEAIVGGSFRGTIGMENVQWWQVALVLQALIDIGQGLVRVGGLKSRGFGRMLLSRDEMLKVTYALLPSPGEHKGPIPAVGKLVDQGLLNDYGLLGGDELDSSALKLQAEEGFFRTWKASGQSVIDVARDLVRGPWERFRADPLFLPAAAGGN